MKPFKLFRSKSEDLLSDEQAEQASALLRSGGDVSELIARAALAQSWEENGRAQSEKLAHDRGVQAGTITELFPTQLESSHMRPESRMDSSTPRLRHVKIILPPVVEVELFDQDTDVI